MSTFSLAISCDHFQFALIHGPDIPGSYAILLFTASDLLLSPVTCTAGYCFCFGSNPSFFLELFLYWSPVAYWAPTDLGSLLSVFYHFAFSYCSWDSQGKNTEVVCHSLLQWTTFCEEKKCKKAKWLSGEDLQIAVKRREAKSKGEKERYKHLNAEFQRIARRDKKAFLS